MQGQGNYSAPHRQGPYTNAPPFQQYGSLPPPPPPISQGPRLTRPSVAQQGWPQVGQLRPSVYPNASHGLQQQRPYLNSNLPSRPSQPLSVGTSQMQQHSHSSASFIPSTGLPSAPRVLPPPPSLGQTPFGNQVHQQAPPPPNHNTARFYASAPVGTFDPLMPSSSAPTRLPPPPPPPLAPPPPPEGPPIPSSSPPANLSLGISKRSDHGDTGPNVVSTHDDGSSSDLPPAPPKPADDKIARTIELLCQFIAKNGPEFENMTRLKQRENPEFKFLFGAEPGSEAAIAHKYYMWTRRKYKLEYSSAETRGTSDSPLRQSGEFSSHHSFTTDQGLPCSPADSDMDMEDDITHPSGEPQSFSSEKQNHETISSSSGLERKQEVQPSLTSVDTGITKDDVDGNQSELQHSEPGSGEQREGKPSTEIDGLDTRSFGDDELPVHLSKTDSTHESLGNPCTPVELAEIRLETVPNLHGEQGGSYFRLLPDYESDRSSGDEDQPTTVIPSVGVGSSSHHMDERVDLGRDCDTERVAETDKGLECPAQSSKLSSVVVAPGKDFIAGESEDVVDNRYDNQESLRDDIPDEPCQFVFSKDDEMKDPKDVSSSLKVDEFGRLIRENNSDSDDDSPRYSRRKRGRSRSRSRSPQDIRRRRSPRRRNDMRSRSRSFSPKRRRSRSKSPPPARHGGVPARRDKRGVCFNFVNGKHCYRGASCRYLHQDDESDRSRSRWGRQQFHDSPRTSGVHERSDMPHKKLFSEGKNLDRKHYDDSAITEDKKCLKAAVDGTAVNIPEKDGDLEPSVHLQNGDQQHQQVEICSSFTSQLPKDGTHLNDEPVSQLCDNSSSTNKTDESRIVSEEPVVHKESVLPAPDHPANLMLPVFPSAPQPRNSNLAPSASAATPNQASYPPSQFSFSPNQPWNSLPPPPPASYPLRPVFGSDTFLPPRPPQGGATEQFALNIHPPRNDYFSQTPVRPYVTEFPHPSNVGQNQGYHYLQEQNRPQANLDDHQQKTSVASKPVMGQSHGPGSEGSSLSQSQPLPVPEDSISKRRPYPGEIPPLAGGVYAPQGEQINQNSSLPTYASGHDRNQPLMLSNLGVPMIRNHFNPYASTFEQPLSVTTLSQNHAEGRAPPNLSSVQPVERVLPERGGDQYDPLCDSLEPSVNAPSKSHYGQKHEITNESDDMLRFSGSTKPLDGEETMQKMGGASEVSGSFENDEFGETADAEVGAVENGSPSNLLQVNSPGKSKESRSMKLFKVAIASFAKEVLKPSWRQGNMSKEAFKTIVKKTVDRVSGAMKSHQIPRSQAKINHYIDSSQRKLTKLVMGYVDKYVKV